MTTNTMTKEELWDAVLGELELTLSHAHFVTWFKNTGVFDLKQDEVSLAVPNIFAKEWLEKKYKSSILGCVRKFFPAINKFSCVIAAVPPVQKNTKTETNNDPFASHLNASSASNFSSTINNEITSPAGQKVFIRPGFFNNLNPRYNFDSFVVGGNNELAYAACRAVADNPGNTYNPVFIYGSVGLGKTHLLQATGNWAISQNPNIKVRYVSMERFANELLSALQSNRAREFKDSYMQLDILILDDVQFLANKEKTQEEFFHIFEYLYQNRKQLILSSDRCPKSIPTLEDRLRSRFEGGMMADINKPDLETRIAIIRKKLAEKNFALDDQIVLHLAQNIYHNIRELEGAINKIIVTYQFKNVPTKPTFNEVVDLSKDVFSSNRKQELTVEKVLQSVSDFYNVKPEEITSHCRKKKVVKPRQVAIYLLRQEINLSFPEIGDAIGGRDHSTAIYACDKIADELEKNSVLKDQIKFIREKFIEY